MDIRDLQYLSNLAIGTATAAIAVKFGVMLYAHWDTQRTAKPGRILVHVPAVWTLPSLFESVRTLNRPSGEKLGQYIPCRPHVHMGGLRHRLRCAWLAFSGRCDLVRWPEEQ